MFRAHFCRLCWSSQARFRLRDYGSVALLKVLCAWEGKKREDPDAMFMRNLLNQSTGGMRLAAANREWHYLELLDLSDNDIEETGGLVVAALICLGPKLLQCNVDWNSIRGRGAAALGQALNNVPQTLRAFSLDHNPLGNLGAAAIADALVCVPRSPPATSQTFSSNSSQIQRRTSFLIAAALLYRRHWGFVTRLWTQAKPKSSVFKCIA
jgi:hypothetical protein